MKRSSESHPVAAGRARSWIATAEGAAASVRQPLQLLSKFRNPDSRHRDLKEEAAPTNRSAVPDLQTNFEGQSRKLPRRNGPQSSCGNSSLRNEVVELGAVPYGALHHLYRSCDVYATPAYAETFAHPLVEAMASGLPVIASDLAVHREICGEAAHVFPAFCAGGSWPSESYKVSQSPDQDRRCEKRGFLAPETSVGISMSRSCCS